MRFAVLSSGSSGNATLIQAAETSVLIDCGLSVRQLALRAEAIGFDLATLDAVLVTHEHSDHIGGVARLARRYGLPTYMTHGTRRAADFDAEQSQQVHEISPHQAFRIGAIELHPSPVPHDAAEPCQFVAEHDDTRLGLLTDLGSETPYIRQHFAACDALVLEFNHDLDLLANCEYPSSVKSRIAGRLGHFNNDQAADLLSDLHGPRLQHVFGAHISERANQRDIVLDRLRAATNGSQTECALTHPDKATAWISL